MWPAGIRLARGDQAGAGLDLDSGAGYRLAAGIQNYDVHGRLRRRLGTQRPHLPETAEQASASGRKSPILSSKL